MIVPPCGDLCPSDRYISYSCMLHLLVSAMFCKRFGEEMLVVEYSIFVPEYNFYLSVECGMPGVSRFW
jgi:hypothetical protein